MQNVHNHFGKRGVIKLEAIKMKYGREVVSIHPQTGSKAARVKIKIKLM